MYILLYVVYCVWLLHWGVSQNHGHLQNPSIQDVFSLWYEATERMSNTENHLFECLKPTFGQNEVYTIWVSQEHKSMMDLPTMHEDVYTSSQLWRSPIEDVVLQDSRSKHKCFLRSWI